MEAAPPPPDRDRKKVPPHHSEMAPSWDAKKDPLVGRR
jgi:hypothetical protein